MKKVLSLEVIVVFLMTVAAYGYFFSGTDWNTNSRMAMVKAVVEENRFEIDSFHRKGLITRDEAKLRGHFYSDKAIGSALIGIAFYLPIYHLAQFSGNVIPVKTFIELISFLAIGLICAFLAPFLYSFAKRISGNTWFALLVCFAICLGTPIYKYSTFYYGHVLAGLFLFVVFFIWFSMKDEERIHPTKVLISGYLLGFAVITEYPTVLMVAILGGYILYVLWKKQALWDVKIYIRLGIGMAIPIILLLTYNTAIFRHPFKTGYGYEVIKEFRDGQQIGLMGIGLPNLAHLFYMTFHTTMGVFWQSPVLLCAFWGWLRMWQGRQYRAEAVFSFGLALVYFLMMSGYYMWWGGAAFTPRSLIPVFPFFGIPLVFLVRKPEKIWLAIFALISIVQMFVVVAGDDKHIEPVIAAMGSTSFQTLFQPTSMVYNIYLPNFINQLLGVNRGKEFFHLEGFASLIPFFVLEVCLVAVFALLTANRKAAASQSSQQPEVLLNDGR